MPALRPYGAEVNGGFNPGLNPVDASLKLTANEEMQGGAVEVLT